MRHRFAFALVSASIALTSPAWTATAPSSVHATRLDPYKNFRFRIEFGGRVVAGISKVTVPTKPAKLAEYREGNDPPHTRPGRTKYEPITLERGLTHDNDFEAWAAAHSAGSAREVRIVELNEQGRPVQAWRVHRAWVSEYQALPDLDAGANAIAIQHIKLENEGWER